MCRAWGLGILALYIVRAGFVDAFVDAFVVNRDRAGVRGEVARDGVEQCGLSGTVAADCGDEVSFFQPEVDAVERNSFVDRAGEEGLGYAVTWSTGLRPSASVRGGSSPEVKFIRKRASTTGLGKSGVGATWAAIGAAAQTWWRLRVDGAQSEPRARNPRLRR